MSSSGRRAGLTSFAQGVTNADWQCQRRLRNPILFPCGADVLLLRRRADPGWGSVTRSCGLEVRRRARSARRLGGHYPTPAQPSDAQEPASRCSDHRWIARGKHVVRPSSEPPPRGRRIDPRSPESTSELRGMTACVEQHIGDCISDLARSPQHVYMAAVREDGAVAPKHSVRRSSEPRTE